jgi:hypothetical protein
MPLQSTTGTASYDGFGGSATAIAAPTYIEDVFSTWRYTGNGGINNVVNGVNLSGNGGMVWLKSLGSATDHSVTDTARGSGFPYPVLVPNSSSAATASADGVYTFNSDGFSTASGGNVNTNASSYVSWTFRKAPKFFDIVTWTGDGSPSKIVSHALASTPGFIIIKPTSASGNWSVVARTSSGSYVFGGTASSTNGTLNGSLAFPFSDTTTNLGISSSSFNAGTLSFTWGANTNNNGTNYVAYLFAHDAGGFGLSGTDNVISCGSYVGTGNTAGVGGLLGWEPQWLLIKNTTSTADWVVLDNLRGMSLVTSSILAANTNASQTVSPRAYPYQYGFNLPSNNISVNESGSTYIYIAIRRGPMRRPTSGTSVYSADLTSAATKITTGFPVDFQLFDQTTAPAGRPLMTSRLTGFQYRVAATAVEQSVGLVSSNPTTWDNTGFTPISALANSIFHSFRRAPGFFDTVIYGGNGTTQTVPHGLGVPPELIIFRYRNVGTNTSVLSIHINNNPNSWTSDQQLLILNLVDAKVGVGTDWLGNNTSYIAPTAAAFTIGSNGLINQSGGGYTAFLFASVPGVSKIGRYTGNGGSQTIDCGFTAGARFILIKGLNFSHHWHVFDTARGIVAGNDPFNNFIESQADVTSEDCIDPDNSGFIVNQTATGQLNANTSTYLYFAIA